MLVAFSPSFSLTFHSCPHSFRTSIRAVVCARRVRRRLRVAAATRRVDSDQSDDCVARASARPTLRRPAVDVVIVASIVVIIVVVIVVVLYGRKHCRRTRSPRGRARVQALAVRAGMECDGFDKGMRIISGRTVAQIFSATRFFKRFFQRYFPSPTSVFKSLFLSRYVFHSYYLSHAFKSHPSDFLFPRLSFLLVSLPALFHFVLSLTLLLVKISSFLFAPFTSARHRGRAQTRHASIADAFEQ